VFTDTQINCTAATYPLPSQYIWTINNVQTTGQTASLSQPADNLTCTCTAVNSEGNASQSITVTVTPRPTTTTTTTTTVTVPQGGPSADSGAVKDDSSTPSPTTLGLAIGLGVGIPVLLLLILLICCCVKSCPLHQKCCKKKEKYQKSDVPGGNVNPSLSHSHPDVIRSPQTTASYNVTGYNYEQKPDYELDSIDKKYIGYDGYDDTNEVVFAELQVDNNPGSRRPIQTTLVQNPRYSDDDSSSYTPVKRY